MNTLTSESSLTDPELSQGHLLL